MNKFSIKIIGNYKEVGEALEGITGENKQATEALFRGLVKESVNNLQLAPYGNETEDGMVAIANFNTDKNVPTENLDAFKSLFPSADIELLVLA